MVKIITIKWLKSQGACEESIKAWHGETDHDTFATLNRLLDKNPEWGSWLICRIMNKNQSARYAIFAAEQVIDIYERKYPDDKRPRNAIEAAKAYLKNPCAKTKAAAVNAYAAAYAAYAAAYAYATANVAYAASNAAAYAAAAASNAAASYADDAAASNASNASDDAAAYTAAARAATYTYAAAERRKMQAKILKYGIGLLKQA